MHLEVFKRINLTLKIAIRRRLFIPCPFGWATKWVGKAQNC